jgi:hypothetical protein
LSSKFLENLNELKLELRREFKAELNAKKRALAIELKEMTE